MLPIGHFDIYLGEWFERSSSEQLAFFTGTLCTANKHALKARKLSLPALFATAGDLVYARGSNYL